MDAEDKYPLAKMFVDAFEKKYGYKPEWGANNAYMSVRAVGRGGRERRHLLSARRDQVVRGRPQVQSTVGEVYFRKEDHQLVRPVVIVSGKKPANEEQGGFLDVVEIVPGAPLMQKPDAFGCKLGDYT